ncbi:MAG: imidazoleglycerol-phosphate dehydratase HisB [Candidatus Latescibacteria bacterium]|nr:imidazoleglycerol-phosphate dehydratase HisB [Candidatus Latescibacterota bacterium]
MSQSRSARIVRKTSETDIELALELDGEGLCKAATGIGFFDHMLNAFSRHGLFDLDIQCRGDLEVDAHHSVEDVGICLGQAIDQALGDKSGLVRFGHSYVPMDDALGRVAIDLSGRAYMVLEAEFGGERVGAFPVALVREFFRAVADQGRMNLHLDLLRSQDDHHGIEALFKAFGRALDQASQRSERVRGIPSTKGQL